MRTEDIRRWLHVSGKYRKIYEVLTELLFPPRCPICDKIQKMKEKGICPECRKKIRYIREPRCMKCSKQLSDEEQEYCKDCTERDHFYKQGRALFDYRAIDRAIYKFKYKGRKEYGEILGEEMAYFLGDYIHRIKPDALIPVPMYPAKKRVRGYNQAEVLADMLGKYLNVPVRADLVKRVKNTRALKALNRKERLNNLKNAFNLEGNGVKLNTIIIVDDIYTTGSTIDAVAKVFLKAGVENIYFVTLAIGEGS